MVNISIKPVSCQTAKNLNSEHTGDKETTASNTNINTHPPILSKLPRCCSRNLCGY